jgi:hypothetical protein
LVGFWKLELSRGYRGGCSRKSAGKGNVVGGRVVGVSSGMDAEGEVD